MIVIRPMGVYTSLRIRLCEWLFALVAIWWGAVLLLPGPSLSEPALSEITRLASETAWGFVLLALGWVRLVVLVINGSWRRCSHARSILALFSCFAWTQMWLAFIAADLPVAAGVYLMFVGADMFTIYRAARDARAADDAAVIAPNAAN